MKKLLLSSLLAAGAFSMFSACSDDPVTASSPIAAPTSSDSGYPGTSSSSSAIAPIPGSSSAVVPGSSGSNPLSSSSSVVPSNPLSSSSVVAPVPGSSSSVVNPSQSSSSVNPTSSATPGSSAVESSSSNGPVKTVGNPKKTLSCTLCQRSRIFLAMALVAGIPAIGTPVRLTAPRRVPMAPKASPRSILRKNTRLAIIRHASAISTTLKFRRSPTARVWNATGSVSRIHQMHVRKQILHLVAASLVPTWPL